MCSSSPNPPVTASLGFVVLSQSWGSFRSEEEVHPSREAALAAREDLDQGCLVAEVFASFPAKDVVLREHTLTPGGWECEGCFSSSWNSCPALLAVLTPEEHEALMQSQ